MDKLLLKYHRERNGDTIETLARALGMHPKSLQRKIRKEDFSIDEVEIMARRYKLTTDDVMAIFFTSPDSDDHHDSQEGSI